MRKMIYLWLLSTALPFHVNAETASRYDRFDELSLRIIGGEKSSENDWPFMTALVKNNAINTYKGQFCGASYIGQGFVLTAAHCIDNKRSHDFHVHIGIYDLSKSSTQGQAEEVRAIYIHPAYNRLTHVKDIALIELISQPNLPTVKLATGYKNNEISERTMLTVMGWGKLTTKINSYPNILHQVNLPYVPRSSCQNLGKRYNNITDSDICAGFLEGGKDSCQGDSGGPLVYSHNGGIEQVGVVSWGDGCAQPNAYGVYANVAYFQDWIAEIKESGISYTQYTYRKVTQPTVEEELVIENTSDTALSILDIELDPDSKLTITTNTCIDAILEPSNRCSIRLTSTSKKLFTQRDDTREVQQLVVTTNRSNNEKLSFFLVFERDKPALPSSSSGGSIGWSLFGLGLLGWLRFRKGVRL